MAPGPTEHLNALARYAGRLLLENEPPLRRYTPSQRRSAREQRRTRTAPVEQAVLREEFPLVFQYLRECEAAARFRFLERAVDFIPPTQRITCFHDVWVTTKDRPLSTASLVRLFRAAPELRGTIPMDLPNHIPIYRGVFVPCAQRTRHAIRRPSWALDARVANRFAQVDPMIESLALVDPERFAGKWCAYLASATVDRHDVLAFFNDERQEVECVVDPATLRDVRTERLDAVRFPRGQ